MPKAIVLLSGGLDSAVTLAHSLRDGNETIALSFRYGQRHTRESDSAKAIANYYEVEHRMIDIDLSSFNSSLIGNSRTIETNRTNIGNDIPETYVPARNLIMLSVATGLCESLGASSIYIGANAVDYSGYPDCRKEFFDSFSETIRKGTKAGVEDRPIKIVTPILNMSKAEIIKTGKDIGVPFRLTWSCYNGGEKACGHCDSCLIRLKGFKEAGYEDEVEYQ